MFKTGWAYLLPFIPLVSRMALGARWRILMMQVPPEEAQERDLHRATILSFAGFSFTAVAGLAVLDANTRSSLQLPIWYVLISFVAYLSASNLQSYKTTRWHNQLAFALADTGSLSLSLTIVVLILGATLAPWFYYAVGAVTLGAWLLDHSLRLLIDHRYYREVAANPPKGGTP